MYVVFGVFVTLSALLINVMLVRLTPANKGNFLTYLLTYLKYPLAQKTTKNKMQRRPCVKTPESKTSL